ncbi:MFS transporter [Streptomyces sp. MBT65]|nr:MFS transporter [Streptomyces sp. MBT65]
MLLSALSLHRWRLYGMEGIDPTLSDHWPTPPLVFVPGPSDSPVLVSVV